MSLFEIGKKLISLFKGEYTIKRKFRGDEKKRLQNKIKEYKVYEGIKFAEHNTVLHEIDTLHDFHLIPEIPVIEFNEYQSKNLISSIIDLKNTYDEVGAVKIRLHPKHLPKLSLLKSQKKLFVRQQVIPLLSEGKVLKKNNNSHL